MTADGKRPERRGINTRPAQAGHDPFDHHGFLSPPVVRASTVLFPTAEAMATHDQRYTYGTRGTPTTDAFEAAIDDLGGAAGTISSRPGSLR